MNFTFPHRFVCYNHCRFNNPLLWTEVQVQRLDQRGVVYYQFEQWANSPALTHGIFTRIGGRSTAPFDSLNVGGTVGDDPDAVEQNVALTYETLGLDQDKAVSVWQVHSADVVIAEERAPGRRWLARADGLVTNRVGLPLSMRFADCIPVLFYDPVHHVIGIAHAGWRGTVSGVVARTLETMTMAFGTDPADVQAAIGPGIGPDCYQVGLEVVEAVQQAFDTIENLIRCAEDGTAYLNLWASNALALERAGVRHIEIAGICTATNTAEFYSHRAEHGKTGRFGAIIALKTLKESA